MRALIFLLLLPTIASAAPPLRSPRALADGCVVTGALCNTAREGQFAPGDCTDEAGYFDVYQFRGLANTLVEITVRSLDPNLPNVYVGLAPPEGDASLTPATYGNRSATIRYHLATTGDYRVVAGSADLAGSGRYHLQIACFTAPVPADRNCIPQPLACNQVVEWDLAPGSCDFDSTGGLYAEAAIEGVAGDVLRLEADTIGFQPIVAVYNEAGTLVSQSFAPEIRHAQLDYFIPANGTYYLLVTGVEPDDSGHFAMKATCSNSGCSKPFVITEPPDVTASYGGNVTVTANVHAVGATTYEWLDVTNEPSLVTTTTSPSLTFTNVTGRRAYLLRAANACGFTESRIFEVDLEVTKRRAVRH